MNATETKDSEHLLTDRDIPSLIGASSSPSLWEIYNRIKGRIDIGPIESTRSWWRSHLFKTVLIGLQDRYGCVLTHGKRDLTRDGVEVRPLTKILNHGRLPLRRGLTHLKLRQASSHEITAKWKAGQGYEVPAETAAELHPMMEHLDIQRLGIVLIVDGGADEIFVELERSEALLIAIKDAVSSFKARLVFDDEPDPDFAIDGSEIEKIYRPLTEEIVDLRTSNTFAEVVATYERLSGERKLVSAKEKDLNDRIKPLKAQIVKALGTAKGAYLADGSIVSRTESQVEEATRKAYTTQRINIKREAVA